MPPVLKSFLAGRWQQGSGKPSLLVNPSTEEALAETSSEGLDLAAAVAFSRDVGGPALRAMTFAKRSELLKKLAKIVNESREELLGLAVANGGNTRSDAKFDIDGASSTLLYYAELGEKLGDVPALLDGEGVALGRSARLWGQHVLVPREGVAVHINAFNFPAWGMGEKLAVALLAGVPVITKPATATSWVAHRMVEKWVSSGVLPEGALSLLCGSAGALLAQLGGQDVVAFTGSSATATTLRQSEGLARNNVHLNVEADSLNGAVLGPDAGEATETEGLFLSDVTRELTQKAGQKCTAVRRIYVPEARLAAIRDALVDRLSGVRVGNPADEKVTMGPLATAAQLAEVRRGIDTLAAGAEVALGGARAIDGQSAPAGKGYFVAPTLLVRRGATSLDAVNNLEVFGPVATLMPYRDVADLGRQVAAGGGGLVTSVYSEDRAFAQSALLRLAPYHGRLVLTGEKLAGQSISPGAVLPQLLHGGPGRAGGGEELGGLRGLSLYLQRTAVQGHRAMLEAIFKPGQAS